MQNIQNKPKLQKWSKSNDLHRFDVKTIKTFKTKLNYKSDQNPMSCIDLTSKRSKCWVTSQNIQNKAKLQKWSKSNDLHRFDVKTIKMLSYVAKHSKQSETTKVIQIQWLASIWRQNDQNVELRRKTFKTKQNYKSDQNPMTCIDLTSKRSKCWVTSQNIQNKAKLQKWSKSNDLHRFDVKTIKTFKTKLNYKSDQNPMSCIDLTSKRSKCWVTSQNIQKKAKLQKWSKSNDLHRFDVKTIKMLRYFENIQNNAKLQNWSKSNDLHRFDVKTIKMLSYVAKHSKQS